MNNRFIVGIILAIFFVSMLGCAWVFAFQMAMSAMFHADCHGFQSQSSGCDLVRSISSNISHHFFVFSQIQHAAAPLLFGAFLSLIFFFAARIYISRAKNAKTAWLANISAPRLMTLTRRDDLFPPLYAFLSWFSLDCRKEPAFASLARFQSA